MSLTSEDKHWIMAQIERVETALLTEFHKWASSLEMRVKNHSARFACNRYRVWGRLRSRH